MKILVVAIQKGGVGKTTTVVNVAHALAQQGKKVMIIDLDTQGQSATYLNIDPEPGVYNWLAHPIVQGNLTLEYIGSQVRFSGRNNLFIIPGNQATSYIPMMIANDGRHDIKRHFSLCLRPLVNSGLDYIIFDTPPSRGPVQEGAIWVSDFVLVPTAMEYGSLEGVNALMAILKRFTTEESWKGQLVGILPTFFEGQIVRGENGLSIEGGTVIAREQFENLVRHFGEDAVLPPIHESVVFREATAEGKTIFEMEMSGRKAEYIARAQTEYLETAKRILKLAG